MTIDYLIGATEGTILHAKHLNGVGGQDLRQLIAEQEELLKLLEELKWYREQDLIKREDLLGEIEKEYLCSKCVNHGGEDCEWCIAGTLKTIPKAEPPTGSEGEI